MISTTIILAQANNLVQPRQDMLSSPECWKCSTEVVIMTTIWRRDPKLSLFSSNQHTVIKNLVALIFTSNEQWNLFTLPRLNLYRAIRITPCWLLLLST